MQPARIPENEEDRLAALREYEVLDTLPEREYDDLTFLAATICEMPIALISLVDQGRQWFKSAVGLDASETPRDLAFCAHAILDSGKLFVVPDASCDERFAGNPLVEEGPEIRFYAGAPLVTPEGSAIGTLCVIDQKPRRLSAEQSEALQALSRQVVTQLELRRTIRELETRTVELEASRQEVIRSNEDLENFAHVAAHDLGVPLRQIKTIAALLEGEVGDKLTEEQRETFAYIGASADRGKALVEDILDYSRLGSRDEAEPVDLDRMLTDLRDARLNEGMKGAVEWGEMPTLRGHRGQLSQLFENLIGNALKYNESEMPTVRLDAGRDDTGVFITCTDNGLGIPEKLREQVFEMFSRADSSPKRKGSGIGLAICRRVMELHDGQVTIAPGEAGGSVFTCQFPMERVVDDR